MAVGLDMKYTAKRGREWKKSARFSRLVGKTGELFYSRESHMFYAGTYKALDVMELSADDCLRFGKCQAEEVCATVQVLRQPS